MGESVREVEERDLFHPEESIFITYGEGGDVLRFVPVDTIINLFGSPHPLFAIILRRLISLLLASWLLVSFVWLLCRLALLRYTFGWGSFGRRLASAFALLHPFCFYNATNGTQTFK